MEKGVTSVTFLSLQSLFFIVAAIRKWNVNVFIFPAGNEKNNGSAFQFLVTVDASPPLLQFFVRKNATSH